MQRTLRAVLMAAVVVGAAQPALAQSTPWEDRVFANLSFGVDTGTTEIVQSRNFIVYSEPGSVQANAEFGSFPIFDLSFGARVYRNVAVAISYHTGGSNSEGTLTGTVPHPQFFDRPRSVVTDLGELDRDEHATHLQVGWMVPLNDKFDVFLFGGPSFYRVTQEMIGGASDAITITEQGAPFSSVTVGVQTQRLKENAVGYNFGVDGTYFVRETDRLRIGVGALLRFTGASVDFNVGGEEFDTDAGGVQFLVGARLRF